MCDDVEASAEVGWLSFVVLVVSVVTVGKRLRTWNFPGLNYVDRISCGGEPPR